MLEIPSDKHWQLLQAPSTPAACTGLFLTASGAEVAEGRTGGHSSIITIYCSFLHLWHALLRLHRATGKCSPHKACFKLSFTKLGGKIWGFTFTFSTLENVNIFKLLVSAYKIGQQKPTRLNPLLICSMTGELCVVLFINFCTDIISHFCLWALQKKIPTNILNTSKTIFAYNTKKIECNMT